MSYGGGLAVSYQGADVRGFLFFFFSFFFFVRSLVSDIRVSGPGVDDVVRQVDEKLGEAALGGSVVTEHRREGRVAEGFGETLPEGLAGAGVITEATVADRVVVSVKPSVGRGRGWDN